MALLGQTSCLAFLITPWRTGLGHGYYLHARFVSRQVMSEGSLLFVFINCGELFK